jgi:hypothetical protein
MRVIQLTQLVHILTKMSIAFVTVVTVHGLTIEAIPSIPARTSSAVTEGGFHIEGNRIFRNTGAEFIPVGFNSVHIWLDEAAARHGLEHELAKTGANFVRLVTAGEAWTWNHQSETPAKKRELVELALKAGLIPMLELHDATCVLAYDRPVGEGKAGLKQVVDHWLLPENVATLKQYEDRLWLNIANEWGPSDDPAWAEGYKQSIQRLRAAGIRNMLVIDAGGCGQDPKTLLKWGDAVAAADPLKKVVLSIHLYKFWSSAGKSFDPARQYRLETYLPKLKALKTPVIIGEFGSNGPDVGYDYHVLVQTANKLNMGWLFWAWYDGAGHPPFNAVSNPGTSHLTPVGEFLVNDPGLGLRALAVKRKLIPPTPAAKKPRTLRSVLQ